MPTTARVLVVDDDADVARQVSDVLTRRGSIATAVVTVHEAMQLLQREAFDVVITDLRLGDTSGLDLIAWIKKHDARIAVVAITAFGSIDTAVRAIKLGAFDYLTKPFSPDALLLSVEKATRERQLRVELVRLREAVDRSRDVAGLVGRSRALEDIVSLVRRAGTSNVAVLVTGANGTGKATIARAIHAASTRKRGALVSINCAAIPPGVLEVELFGVAGGPRGVFAESEGGTVVLSHVSALSPALQERLVELLESNQIRTGGASVPADVRIIATSNHDLSEDVRENGFSEKLYYLLQVIEVRVPPLRDRPEDITPLAQHFLHAFVERTGKKIVGFNEAALKQLAVYPWPGNVRELETFVERAGTLSDHNVIRAEDLPDLVRTRADTDFLAMAAAREMTLADLERAYLLRVLERTGGNKLRAAQILGIDRKTIYRWLGAQADPGATGDDPA